MQITLPVTIHGPIIHGNKIGTSLGIPTANIYPDIDISFLKLGVYYSVFSVDQKEYYSITNLGVRPTISSGSTINTESFIFNFSGNLYGKEGSVKLLEFLREEKKFLSLDELQAQIKADLSLGKAFHHIK